MKIDFSKRIDSTKTNIYAGGGIYELTNSKKYAAAIHNWNEAAEIVNLKTGLVIGYISKSGARFEQFCGGFVRSWGFRKDLGKSGRILESIR